MESGHNIKREELDPDEIQSEWFGYACKSGGIMFYYNIKTGEHRWPSSSLCSENTILRVQISDVPQIPIEVCTVATQTEDYGCVNQCTSIYVDNERNTENKANESIEIKEEISDDDMIDEQNTLNSTGVDDNLDKVSEDHEMDESLSNIIVTEMKRNTNFHNCPYCSRTFKQRWPLDIHIRKHTDEKPYKCWHCAKAFTKKGNFDSHLRTHTGEKPYECSHCDRAFTQKGNLDVHLRTHTGEKPFECSHCDKAFTRRSSLVEHERAHTGEKPYECSHCNKGFALKSNLTRHLRTHTSEKPFECSYCGKAFIQKIHLQVHLRTHTGEKPYKCLYCEKAFIAKRELNIHLQKHSDKMLQ